MKKTILILGALAIVCLVVLLLNPDRLDPNHPAGKTIYYTVIDQQEPTKDTNGRYNYTLTGYTAGGQQKKLDFSTGMELQEGTCVKLYQAPLRGITHWEEISVDELPEAARQLTGQP